MSDTKEIEEIVKDIMQEGFDVAMTGNPFKSEEENKAGQEQLYNEVVAKRTRELHNLIKQKEEEAVRGFVEHVDEELTFVCYMDDEIKGATMPMLRLWAETYLSQTKGAKDE